MVDLTDSDILEDVTSITRNGHTIDLHNDFDCVEVTYSNGSLNVMFEQTSQSESEYVKVCIVFKDAEIAKLKLDLANDEDQRTIDTLYRGRFEANGELFEHSTTGKRYFYISFQNGNEVELFTSEVMLVHI
jgi:hypothetical protein